MNSFYIDIVFMFLFLYYQLFLYYFYTALKLGLLDLPKKLNVIKSHEVGIDLKLPGGQNHPAGRNRSVLWSATFESIEDYESYDTSKEHINVVTSLIKPIIVPGSRSAIQYRL